MPSANQTSAMAMTTSATSASRAAPGESRSTQCGLSMELGAVSGIVAELTGAAFMKLFRCDHCSNVLYFENTVCEQCGHALGYWYATNMLVSLEPEGDHFIA